MSRHFPAILAVVVQLSVCASAWPQQAQSGQAGAAGAGANTSQSAGAATATTAGATGQSNPGAASAARAGMPGQSGTISDFGPAAPQQGQFFPGGQRTAGPTAGVGQFTTSGRFVAPGEFNVGSQFNTNNQFNAGGGQFNTTGQFTTGGQLITGNQFVPGGAATTRFNQVFGTNTFGPVASSFTVSPTPWFSAAAIRQQLQLNAIEYHHLYSAYADAYSRYNQAVNELPANLLAAERSGRLQALQEVFNAEFDRSLEATLANPELRQQFNNLRAQYQTAPGNAPAVGPGLSLTAEQHRRLSLMAHQWNQLAARLRERAADDEEVAREEVDELNSEAEEQIESTLTPEQEAIWPQLVGQYYDLAAPKPKPQEPARAAAPEAPGDSEAPATPDTSATPTTSSE